jgi:branched-chain amino acid transport system permease protein
VTVIDLEPEQLDQPAARRPSRLRRAVVPVLVAAACIAVLSGSSLLTRTEANMATTVLLLAGLGMAWNLIAGFGGQFSLGHSIFIGLGGYLTAILMVNTGLPLYVGIIIAAVVAALVGVVLAYPLLRLRGPYFSIGTLALTLAVIGWMTNWEFTNKSQSYSFPPDSQLDVRQVYTLAAVIAVLTFLAILGVVKSPLGLRLRALRDDESGAISLGVRRTATLIPVWALSAFLTGLVGAAYGVQRGTLDPQSAFSLQFTMDAIVVGVIGGLGTISGPVLGAIAVYWLRYYTEGLDSLALFVEALVVVLVVRVAPGGIVGIALSLGRRLRRARRRTPEPTQLKEAVR